ncbi:type II secretion system F family protein [Galactobacter caseinivorans]|uniref:type II secretion system F family protein n=1 Tax=Galactobacter caseinivorans TaxID=2676123 RepID=UPI0013146849|nr:type II secretion system F family protein [Galactobacter caseinivorans]
MSAVGAALLAGLSLAGLVLALLRAPGQSRRGASRGRNPAPSGSATRRAEAGPAAHGPASNAHTPLLSDAAAALLASGLSLDAMVETLGGPGPAPELAIVARRLRWGEDWEGAWESAPAHARLRDALELAASTGAPAGALLRDGAQDQRRAWARAEEARANSIAVRLVLPLGLCGLPAFICLGIVPIALALLPWG